MRRRFRIGRFLGANVFLHWTAFVGFATLGVVAAAAHRAANPTGTSAIFAGLLFPLLVLLQEAAYVLVARRNGVAVTAITLYTFGAISETSGDVDDPAAELRMALAPATTSLVLAAVFTAVGLAAGGHEHFRDSARRLAWLNLALVAYGLLPIPPLHGLHVVRAILRRRIEKARATMLATASGAVLAVPLLILGATAMAAGSSRPGSGLILLGFTLCLGSAKASRDLRLTSALEGAHVEDAMLTYTRSAPAHASLAEADRSCFRSFVGDALPVVRDSTVIGLILRQDLRRYRIRDRQLMSVQGAMRPVPPELVLSPHDTLSSALARMTSIGTGALLVVDDGQLRGLLTADAIVVFAEERLRMRQKQRRGRPRA